MKINFSKSTNPITMTQKEFLFKKISNKEFANQVALWGVKSMKNYGVLMIIVGVFYFIATKNISTSLFEAPLILILALFSLKRKCYRNKLISVGFFLILLIGLIINIYIAYKNKSFSGGIVIESLAFYISIRLLMTIKY